MALGLQLNQRFNMLATPYIHSTNHICEINLFDFLIQSFGGICGYKVGRIHGNKFQVTYPDTLGWFVKPPRCELGDICIIAYSRRKKKARLVVIQNKVARTARNALSQDGSQINANLVQYEILATRPRFEFVHGPLKGRASDMIRTARYPSVCIYGNFFLNGKGEADMASITANQFQFKSPQKFPRYSGHHTAIILYPGKYESFSVRNSSGDFVAADNLTDFGDLLEDLYIGKPISPKEKAYIEKELEKAFNTDTARASNTFYSVMQDFQMTDLSPDDSVEEHPIDNYQLIEDYPAQELCNPLRFCRTLLLLNVDFEHPLDLPMQDACHKIL